MKYSRTSHNIQPVEVLETLFSRNQTSFHFRGPTIHKTNKWERVQNSYNQENRSKVERYKKLVMNPKTIKRFKGENVISFTVSIERNNFKYQKGTNNHHSFLRIEKHYILASN